MSILIPKPGETRGFPAKPAVGTWEPDIEAMVDEVAKVVAKHMHGGVASLGTEVKAGTLSPADSTVEMKFMVVRRPWTGMEKMKDSIDGAG